MTEPATRTDTPPGRQTGGRAATAHARFPRRDAPLRVAGTIPANVEPETVRRDVRARRPSLISALIHARALERGLRILSLLALDLLGVAGAIFTALAFKELVRGNFSFDDVWHTTQDYVPFVFLVTALLFSRSGLYSRREARPGFAAIVAGLTLAALAAFAFAIVNGLDFSSYYIFYGGLFFALIWVSTLRWGYERADRPAAARARAPAARDPRRAPASRSTRSRTRSRTTRSGTRYEPVGYISLTPKPDNGLRNLGTPRRAAAAARGAPRAGGRDRRPGLPAGGGDRARQPVPRAARGGAHRAHDDGDHDPPPRARARARPCRCSS